MEAAALRCLERGADRPIRDARRTRGARARRRVQPGRRARSDLRRAAGARCGRGLRCRWRGRWRAVRGELPSGHPRRCGDPQSPAVRASRRPGVFRSLQPDRWRRRGADRHGYSDPLGTAARAGRPVPARPGVGAGVGVGVGVDFAFPLAAAEPAAEADAGRPGGHGGHAGDPAAAGSRRSGSDPGGAGGRERRRRCAPAGSARGPSVRRRTLGLGALAACLLVVAGCGGGQSATIDPSAVPTAASLAKVKIPAGDWMRFDFDAQRSGVGPAATGLSLHNVGALRLRKVKLPGTVDSSAIELHAIKVRGRTHDAVFVTTTYGRTLAIDPGSGRILWEFTPARHPVIRGERPDHDRQPDRRSRPHLHLRGVAGRRDPQAGGGRRPRGPWRRLAGQRHPRRHAREDRRGAQHQRGIGGRDHRRVHRRCPALSGPRGHDRPLVGPDHRGVELAVLGPPHADRAEHVPGQRLGDLGPRRGR